MFIRSFAIHTLFLMFIRYLDAHSHTHTHTQHVTGDETNELKQIVDGQIANADCNKV